MYPVLLTIGDFKLYSYSFFLDLGILVALVTTYRLSHRAINTRERFVDIALSVILMGILGGRAYYAWINHAYFTENLIEVLYLWRGGLSFQGALWGGILALIAHGAALGKFWELADVTAPALALGQAIGWIGCFLNSCVYGLVARGAITFDLPDSYGVIAPRYPSALFTSLLCLVILGITLIVRKYRPFSGAVFLVYMLIFATGQFFIEFTRGDETIYYGLLRVDQVLYLVEGGGALVLLFHRFFKSRELYR